MARAQISVRLTITLGDSADDKLRWLTEVVNHIVHTSVFDANSKWEAYWLFTMTIGAQV